MLDIGWSEMLLIAVVAIVVIGPKDLPRTLRMVGQWVARARRVAREFKDSVDDMVRESELEELRRETEKISRFTVEEPNPAAAPRIEPEAATAEPPSQPAAADK